MLISSTIRSSPAASMECFECHSLKSMKECTDFQKRTRCPRETDRCRNMTFQVYVGLLREDMTGFQRGCASQDECVFKRCTGHFAVQYGVEDNAYSLCQVSCCQGNLCPEGNTTGDPGVEGPVKGARQSGSDVVRLTSFFVTAGVLLIQVIGVFFV